MARVRLREFRTLMRPLFAFPAILIPVTVAADDAILVPKAFAFHEAFSVHFHYQVEEECLPDPARLRNAFEAELLRIDVVMQESAPAELHVLFAGTGSRSATGEAIDCLAIYFINFIAPVLLERGDWVTSQSDQLQRLSIYQEMGFTSSAREDFQKVAEDTASSLGKAFAAAWRRTHAE
jgi:hypothetical protein